MKQQIKSVGRWMVMVAFLAVGTSLTFFTLTTPAWASGGSGSGGGSTGQVDAIRVNKCEYAVTGGGYVELLINANSSNSGAHLYAYLPSGVYLGEVQNGGGGRYGGTVFGSLSVPETITILSSAGGSITVATTPFQP